MKKFYTWLFLVVMLFSVVKSGCGGSGGDDVAIPQTGTTTPQTSSRIQVEIDDSAPYTTKYKAFYGRTSGGEWVLLAESTNGSVSFDIDTKYTAFGFEFDITDKTNWLFSDMFHTITASEVSGAAAPQNMILTLGGTESNPTFAAKVDGVTVRSHDSLTDTNARYDWGEAAGDYDTDLYEVVVNIDPPGWYSLKHMAFYGRKPGGNWVNLTNSTSVGISGRYKEFGFEFDITWGTDWPYSNVFWTAAQSEQEAVQTIDIDMSGTVRSANIKIYVNGNVVVNDTDCSSHSRYNW